MRYISLTTFVRDGAAALAKGPVALVFAEDDAEVDTTLRHLLGIGFRSVALFAAPRIEVAAELAPLIHRIDYDTIAEDALVTAVNAVNDAAPGLWLHYCYNAEYLFFPFCENRSVGEMLDFNAAERRDTVLTYVVDLYADDLGAHPDAVSIETAHLDKSGYYALARKDAEGHALERQLDFFGGLRWRFEEHVPPVRRRIDRVGIFRARAGLKLQSNHTFNVAEYNTYACPWHHNLTAAICSFRTAKALKRNPGSTFDIETFQWHNSAPFEWHSQQLLDLGLMEPGQWF